MAFITIAGQNQIAKKQGDNVTLNIASFVLANVPDLGSEPATRIESIPNENVVDQLVVTKSGYVSTNQVVYSLVMGSDIGNYSFNWVGLVDDEGVLIAVTYIPLTPKTKNDGGVPGNTITRNFLLAYTGIQQTTAINVPAETWQIDFSARLSGIDERERLANFDIYGHEGFLGDGWKVTGSAGTYSVAAGIGYVGGIRAKNKAPQEVTTNVFTNEIWLNVSLQGDISDMTAVCEFVIDTGLFEDYVDENGITHYLTKIADIDESGDVFDGRIITYLKDIKKIVDKNATGKRLFTVSGDSNDIVLTTKQGVTPITELNDFDEFSFIVTATNTSSTVTIKIDELDAFTLSGISSDTQIFETALLTVRYISGAFYIAEQINPLTANESKNIGKLQWETLDAISPGQMFFDGGELSRLTHPILFAKAQKTGLIDQAAKDADMEQLGGLWGDGDGLTTFTIPRVDKVIKPASAVRDLGSYEGDAIRNIFGQIYPTVYGESTALSVAGSGGVFEPINVGEGAIISSSGSGSFNIGISFDAARVVPTAAENRSKTTAFYAVFDV